MDRRSPTKSFASCLNSKIVACGSLARQGWTPLIKSVKILDMPKQVAGITKAVRQKTALEAVEDLGKASPKEVTKKVLLKLALKDEDLERSGKNLERRIREDLEDLTNHGRLVCIRSKPNGDPIDEEDEREYKNFRKVYAVPGSETLVPGAGLLLKGGGQLLPALNSEVAWKIEKRAHFPDSNKNPKISFYTTFGGITVHFPPDDIPVKLAIGRMPMENIIKSEDIRKLFGRRSAYLFLNHTTLSAYKTPSRPAHLTLHWKADGRGYVIIEDYNSTNGTQIVLGNFWKILDKLEPYDEKENNRTLGPDGHGPPLQGIAIKPREPFALKPPFLLKVETLEILVR